MADSDNMQRDQAPLVNEEATPYGMPGEAALPPPMPGMVPASASPFAIGATMPQASVDRTVGEVNPVPLSPETKDSEENGASDFEFYAHGRGYRTFEEMLAAYKSPDGGNTGRTGQAEMMNTLKHLGDVLTEMQRQMANTQKQLDDINSKKKAGKDNLPDFHHKDVDKPVKYDGNAVNWQTWQHRFRGFLARRDPRWPTLLEEIQKVCKGQPINPTLETNIKLNANIVEVKKCETV